MAFESKSDLVAAAAVGGTILGALLFAGPQLGRCGADVDCIFGLSGPLMRGCIFGLIGGLILGALLALGTTSEKKR